MTFRLPALALGGTLIGLSALAALPATGAEITVTHAQGETVVPRIRRR